jgi:hypothetical protein
MSLNRPQQQPEMAAKSKDFAQRQNCVRVGSTGSLTAHAPEALRHAHDSRQQGLSLHASAYSLAGAAKLQPSPTIEIRSAVLSCALPCSTIIGPGRRAKVGHETAGSGVVLSFQLSFRSATLSREECAVSLPAANRFLADRTGFGMTRDGIDWAIATKRNNEGASVKINRVPGWRNWQTRWT